MDNIGKEPSGELESVEEDEVEKEMVEQKKGRRFESYADFYSIWFNIGLPEPIIRIHGKRVENGDLVADPAGFIEAVPHKISDRYANMNVYEGGKIVAYFRLDQKNIGQFGIELIERKQPY